MNSCTGRVNALSNSPATSTGAATRYRLTPLAITAVSSRLRCSPTIVNPIAPTTISPLKNTYTSSTTGT